ncbi:hypothetical protein KXD40_009494 [Peronospora effusa]|uniref:Uncharacterized protein n=1 Tax=Peronospora effusa TaxID=542832 RepID=A0A3M6VDX5_9STRA|nr:hypothetical protein DD238_006671 [Peronospora effusa]RQM12838.1 hypothetical protein DD237_007425 [Peronospora effusa]UIZ23840.1 hypothetical protein KXD40_009494 [Peronospora effusa]
MSRRRQPRAHNASGTMQWATADALPLSLGAIASVGMRHERLICSAEYSAASDVIHELFAVFLNESVWKRRRGFGKKPIMKL